MHIKKLCKNLLLIFMIVSFSLFAGGCFFVWFTSGGSGSKKNLPVKRDMISDEQIINAVKNSHVSPDYNITYDDMFTTMFEKVEYNFYTLEEMKANVPDPDDPALCDSVEVLVQYPDNGKSIVFAWNVIFHEDLPGGFRLEKKCIFDIQTQTGYFGKEMDDNITELFMQKLVVDSIVGPLESLVPRIN